MRSRSERVELKLKYKVAKTSGDIPGAEERTMTLKCRDWGDARAQIRDALGLTEVKLYDISEGTGGSERQPIVDLAPLQTACKDGRLLWVFPTSHKLESPPASPGKEKEKGRCQPPVFSLL